MRDSISVQPTFLALGFAAVLLATVAGGCTRSKYRKWADREAYSTIAERNADPRWHVVKYGIELDPRSRYADPYNADCPPIPKDDEAAQRYMRRVDGMKGWKHWYDNGVRPELENPVWDQLLPDYVELTEEGEVQLDINSALDLAYIHSPNNQTQLETLFLTSLDVTRERFELDSQFFASYDIAYDHQGNVRPAQIIFNPVRRQYEILPPTPRPESNVLSIGTTGERRAFEVRRQFATAGTLLAGFANSFVFEFTGPDQGLSASLLNLTFIQPLLRGAGRDIALENLTQSERTLLSNLRSYAQFRQGFYTQVVVGELGVGSPQRFGPSTSLEIFSGQAALGGYVGLLRQLQVIRNAEDNLDLQIRTLAQLEALLVAGLIDLVQVDQFRQNVERDRANLLQSRNDFLRSLDQYKTFTLGLPPNLPVQLNDQLIKQFQLVDRRATSIQDEIAALQEVPAILAADPRPEAIDQLQQEVFQLVPALRENLESVANDLQLLRDVLPERESAMDTDAQATFADEVNQLENSYRDLERLLELVAREVTLIQEGKPPIDDEAPTPAPADEPEEAAVPEPALPDVAGEASDPREQAEARIDRTVILLRNMLRLLQGSILVQARSRLESVRVDEVELSFEEAYGIALQNRLDFMNGRTALVDDYRQIQVTADALQSVLDFSVDSSVSTDRNNPLSFRGSTGRASVGLRFDAPLTRLIERNVYRESLINYQRSRRNFIQSRDRLHLDLRVLLRDLEQLRTNLEIQRRAVAIAIRRVDVTGSELYAPVAPPEPGQRSSPFGPTAAINLLSAQSALRDTQNSFLTAWLNYYAAKLRLTRELGIMTLDPEGRPLDVDLDAIRGSFVDESVPLPEPLPPPVDPEVIEAIELYDDGMIEADEVPTINDPENQ